jgi:glycosyltransferase involved in cell wall biosynthesis
MHILHIETGRNLYGGALQVFYLLKGLHENGFKNSLFCPRGSEISKQCETIANVFAVPYMGDLDLTFPARLYRVIRSERPDIIHVHSRRGADIWGGLAARLTVTPSIITRRVDNPEAAWLARLKYSMYKKIITISDGIRNVLLSEGLQDSRVQLIHSAVDSGKYTNVCDREWFNREFGLTGDNIIIGTLAQFIPRKGHRYIIDAAPEILKKFPECRFLFFGQGPLKNELQELGRKSGLEKFIIFPGFRTDMERVIPCFDILLHPATMEGLGIALLQAASAQVPLIGARAGGIPEIVHDGINGFLIEPGDTSAIVKSVLALLEDPDRRRRFGQAGRGIVESSFSIDAMVNSYIGIYSDIIDISKRGG